MGAARLVELVEDAAAHGRLGALVRLVYDDHVPVVLHDFLLQVAGILAPDKRRKA